MKGSETRKNRGRRRACTGECTDVEARKPRRLLGRQFGRIRLGNAQLGQTPQHRCRKRARTMLVLGAQAVEQRVVLLRVLVKHARVERGRDQIVRGRDGVNVTGQVQVELLHRNDLRPAAAGRAALDAESRPHRRLPHAREDLVAEHGAERLTETNGRRRLALAERRRVDAGNDHIVAVWLRGHALARANQHLGLDRSIRPDLVGRKTGCGSDLGDRTRFDLSNLTRRGNATSEAAHGDAKGPRQCGSPRRKWARSNFETIQEKLSHALY